MSPANVLLRPTFDHEIAAGPSKHRKKLGQGEAILVIRAADPDACYERIKETGAVVIGPPADCVGTDLLPLETDFPGGGGAVVSRWPDRAAALAFRDSPEYAEVKKLRAGTGQFQVVLVDAVPAG